MSSLPKGQSVIRPLYRGFPYSQSQGEPHVKDRNATLPHVGNATPPSLPSTGFSVKLAVAKPPTEGGGRGGVA